MPYRPALFVKEGGLAGVYAYRHDALAVDLRHECTHALLHASLPMVPLWLDEGLAKYFEVPVEQRAFEHPYFGWLRWEMRLGMIRTVSDLEQRRDLSEMGASEYRYSWAWVHFMLHGPEAAHTVLVRYLADIRRGADRRQPVGTTRTRGAQLHRANGAGTSNTGMNEKTGKQTERTNAECWQCFVGMDNLAGVFRFCGHSASSSWPAKVDTGAGNIVFAARC